MGTFLDVAEMLWRTDQVGDRAEDFRAVFEGRSKLQAIYAKANLDIMNIEDVFAAFEMGKTLASLAGYEPAQIENLLHAVRSLIIKTIGLTQRFGGDSHPPEPYWRFARLVKFLQEKATPAHNVSIITFNYDVGCEHGLHVENVGHSYHLGDFEGDKGRVPLLKLHGSLNWGRSVEGSLVPFRMDEFFQKYKLVPGPDQNHWIFDIGSRLEGCEGLRGVPHPEPFLVPPTWNKTQHYGDIAKIWQKAAEVLSKAENIFVTGYSLPPSDAFFRYLYALGTVGPGLLRRFWIFDTAAKGGPVDERFKALLGRSVLPRHDYFENTFQQGIERVSREFGGN